MEPELLKTRELPFILNMPEKKARKVLAAHGVQPVDLGPGRGNGLRWHRRAVMTVIDTLHAEAQAKEKVPKRVRPNTKMRVIDVPFNQLWTNLYGTGSAHQ